MKKLKISYFGTPYFSARFLEKLLTDKDLKNSIEIKLVVTQPIRPVGRKQIYTMTPVHQLTEKYDLQYFTGNLEKTYSIPWITNAIRDDKIDLCLLYAFSNIIPKRLLNLPKIGFWNIHPSLLPKYRGPSPMVYPLILGDKKTGVTLIKLDNQIDHGPIIAQEEMKIMNEDKRPDLEIKLTDLAFRLFKKTIIKLISPRVNELKMQQQNEKEAAFTKLLTKNDGFIPIEILKKALLGKDSHWQPKIIEEYYKENNLTMKQSNNETIFNLFRGLFPWPGIWSTVKIKNQPKRLKLTDMEFIKGKLILKKVQLEGKKEVDFKTFNSAYKIFT